MKKNILYLILSLVIVLCSMECSAQTVSGNKDGHDYVDLGLPSGRLWATCNVGASKPSEYGDYFAWGEITPKENYDWTTYKWCKGSQNTLTKYCKYSDDGTVDSIKTLLAEDDAATANWGAGWRMPTVNEQEELLNGCNWDWTGDFNGRLEAGYVGISKTNGDTIFLPSAGKRNGTDLRRTGDSGEYWSSSLCDIDSKRAYGFFFNTGEDGFDYIIRYYGRSVRAVVK